MWNFHLFQLISYGFESFELNLYPNRGVYWVRLESKQNPSIVFLICTCHLPWVGDHDEILSGVNQRIAITLNMTKQIKKIIAKNSNDIVILGGDFNEDFHPQRILRSELNMLDVFEALDIPPYITHPVRPSNADEESRPNRTLDWIMFQNNSTSSTSTNTKPRCKVIAAYVKSIRSYGYPPPSDHLPLISVFEVTE